MKELSPISYSDSQNSICLECFADTLVYHKTDSKTRNLVAMRIGGDGEIVRGVVNAIRNKVGFEAIVDDKKIIITATKGEFKRSVTHDGIYAEGMLMALDDAAKDSSDEEEVKDETKRKMYIFCEEGDTDSLFSELDKKTAIPLIPEFKDYILSECIKQKILVPLEVLSFSVRFDAYMLEVSNDEKEIEAIVNKGLRSGAISIPGAKQNTELESIKNVSQYLNKYGISIANRIRNTFNPLFDPANEKICDRIKRINRYLKKNVGYSLYPAQLAVAESLKRRLDKSKVGMVVAECGSGKTKIGSVALAAHQNGRKCFNVVLCPSHVTKKWVREIEETLTDTKAEVVYNLADIDRVHDEYINGDKTVYAILSKERARDGYMRRPAVVYSKSKRGYICPSCGAILKMPADDDSGMMVRADQFFFKKENNKNHICEECKSPLWTAINPNDQKLSHNKWIKIAEYGFVYRDFAHRHLDRTKDLKVIDRLNDIINNPEEVIKMRGAYIRYSMSDYIAERFKQIDGCILDELHQFKGDSGQGDAMETLTGCSKKVIGMTATLVNGYSSGMFYLLYRVVPHLMQVDNKMYDKPNAFNNEYGVTETIYELPDSEYNANSKSKKKPLRTRQRPGVSPLVYSRFLIDCAVFLSLNDMGKHLPDYEEIPVELELREDIKKEYDRIQNQYRKCLNRRDGSEMKLMSKFMSMLTTYPDQPYAHEPILEPRDKSILVEPKDLSNPEELHEKDVATLDIVKRKVDNGEKVLIYTSWVKIDAQERLTKHLTDNGYKVAVLKQNVPPEKREAWVQKKLDEEGINVLITNPSLVETGLDLNAFTTLIYYNIGYNLFTFRQSSRRSWRINQTAPRIEVYILYYKGVMQARAIKLMASKLAAATLVEGNFTEEGLASLADTGDMTSELAKELTKGIRDEVEDVADMFKKMAIIKDDTEANENEADYIIIDNAEETPAQTSTPIIEIVSVSDKIRRAMQLAKQATQERQKTAVIDYPVYDDGNGQLSFLDIAS